MFRRRKERRRGSASYPQTCISRLVRDLPHPVYGGFAGRLQDRFRLRKGVAALGVSMQPMQLFLYVCACVFVCAYLSVFLCIRIRLESIMCRYGGLLTDASFSELMASVIAFSSFRSSLSILCSELLSPLLSCGAIASCQRPWYYAFRS